MRSALKRDLDENARPQSDPSGAPADGQGKQPAAPRSYARPRIVETDARAIAADDDADESQAGEPDQTVDVLMSDLQRIMASLDAQRRAESSPAENPPAETPPMRAQPSQSSDPAAAKAPPAPGGEGEALGAVAAAALRAFREGETGSHLAEVSGVGARLIAEEAARIAAERRTTVRPATPDLPPAMPAEVLFAPQHGAGEEPYVYASGEPLAPPERDAVPVYEEAAPNAERTRGQAAAADEFVPRRHRAKEAAPAAPAKAGGFAFDINAFVDELEREAASAGRDWSDKDGEALFAAGRTPVDAEAAIPQAAPVVETAPAAPEMSEAEAAIARALAVDAPHETQSIATWEPEAREPSGAAFAQAPVRPERADSFTWKRFALLGVIVLGAAGAAVALQSVAGRNDGGGAEPTGSAAVESVAPHAQTAELRGAGNAATSEQAAAPVRNVTPKSEDQVAQDAPDAMASSQDASAQDASAQDGSAQGGAIPGASAEIAPPAAQPSETPAAADQAPVDQGSAMDPALAGNGFDASSVATPDVSATPGAELAAAAPAGANAAPAVQAQAPGAADVTAGDGGNAPQAEVPLPKPREAAQLAAASRPATSGAAPSGSATIKSGVTMRAGPDNKAAAIGTLKTGQKVDLVSCKMWCEVVADGKRGFVFKKFVETGAAAQ